MVEVGRRRGDEKRGATVEEPVVENTKDVVVEPVVYAKAFVEEAKAVVEPAVESAVELAAVMVWRAPHGGS